MRGREDLAAALLLRPAAEGAQEQEGGGVIALLPTLDVPLDERRHPARNERNAEDHEDREVEPGHAATVTREVLPAS